MPDAEEARRKRSDLIKREMERRSNDEVLVYNPTTEPFPIKYGGYTHIVPEAKHDAGYGPGQLIVTRYLAMHYCKHMIDKLIIHESALKLSEARRKYKGNFWPEEEERLALRTNNPELRSKYLKEIWKGVKRKFGLDEGPDDLGNNPPDKRPMDEQLLESLNLDEPVEEPKEEVVTPQSEFAKEVSE